MKTIFLLKEQLCEEIYGLLVSYGVNEINVKKVKSYGVPVIGESKKDGVYTLDKLVINVNCDVIAHYSNAKGESDFCDLRLASIEALCETKDWLDNNAEEIRKSLSDEGVGRTYVFRFHTREWTDIKVKADSEEEAKMVAEELYRQGDYKVEDEGVSGFVIENVTAEYMGLN